MLFKFQMRIVFNRDVENLCLVLFDELLKIPIACMLLVAWERAKKDALQIFLKETSKCAHYIFIYIYLFNLIWIQKIAGEKNKKHIAFNMMAIG